MYQFTRIITAVFIITLATSACSSKINSPLLNIKTGPTQTVDIQVPLPEETSTVAKLNLEFAAGELHLAPGGSGYLAVGSATFNAAELEPSVEIMEDAYNLRAGDIRVEGISTCPDNIKNVWDLKLANTPMALNIKAGAYEGSVELGGLSLKQVEITDTGSVFTGSFSEPNKVEMASFSYTTSAGNTELKGLANANFSQMNFTAGAGEYTLSFDGYLQRDARVTIDSSYSTVNIIVPEGVNAQVSLEGKLATVNPGSGWNQDAAMYTTSGDGPTVTINVQINTGTLNLMTE
jgi:hypothetical protein